MTGSVFGPKVVIDQVSAMTPYPGWWGFAGGWAVDLHLGRQTRRHEDIEIAVLRGDLNLLVRSLHASWTFVEPHPQGLENAGTVRPWDGAPLELPVHQVGAQLSSTRIDFVLNEARDRTWLYRRDSRIAMPLDQALVFGDGKFAHLAPEIVILFKSRRRSPEDEADLALLLPTLDPQARSWLADALTMADPANPWLSRLWPRPVGRGGWRVRPGPSGRWWSRRRRGH